MVKSLATQFIIALPGQLLIVGNRILRRVAMAIRRRLFQAHGRRFVFDPFGSYSYLTISVGDDVFIGSGATFVASVSSITIGNHVMFGQQVTIGEGRS